MTLVHGTPAPVRPPDSDTHPPRTLVLAGCHGGAGTSTLARLMGDAADSGLILPRPPWLPLVLVTRGTPHGANRATWVLERARAAGIAPHALVVVSDGPWPEPRLATLRLRLLGGLVPVIVRLPYVARWRYVDDPVADPVPRRVVRALDQIRSATRIPQGGST